MPLIDFNRNPSHRELRLFGGIWLPGFLALMGLMVWYRSGSIGAAAGLGVIAGCVAVLTTLFPAFARLLFFTCVYAAYPIGWVISHLLLMGIYYLVMTPIGLVSRATGRDPLRLRSDRSEDSYWTPRRPSPGVSRYFRQY
jgi:hypothetical protein